MDEIVWSKLTVPDEDLYCQANDCANQAEYLTHARLANLAIEILVCELCAIDSGLPMRATEADADA
ncbi:MAG TPA: hypothetical protein VFB15_11595 [Candidatus Binataceae bacterium]|nr:hypothetical protein [Candidatus Binataceae bacterium]